jgi:hypothetical protein
MALSQAALCEITDVETALSLTPGAQDALLTRLIEAASARINRYCRRTFHRTDEISEYVAGYGLAHLLVSRPPILTIDWIKFDGVAVDTDSYESVGDDAAAGLVHNANGWVWTSSYVQNIAEDSLPGTERNLYQVQYDGGYVTANQVTLTTFSTRTLPYEVEQAAIDLVAYLYLRQGVDPRVQSETVGPTSVAYSVSGQFSQELPAYITGPLAGYRLAAQA